MKTLTPSSIRDSIIDLTHEYILNTKRYLDLPTPKTFNKLAKLEGQIDGLRVLLYKKERVSLKNVTTPIRYQSDVVQQLPGEYKDGSQVYYKERQGLPELFE